MTTSREIRLKTRPVGVPTAADFELATVDVAAPGPGEVQVKNLWMTVDPYMRGRMNDVKSYSPPFQLGKALEGGAIGQVTASNDPAFGTTGAKLRDALGALERSSKWLLERLGSAPSDALAGATPYLRLFGSAVGGCMLANEAMAAKDIAESGGDPARYVTLARFFAENVAVQAGSLERTVIDSAESVMSADAVLLA